jgi:hypothetical protein
VARCGSYVQWRRSAAGHGEVLHGRLTDAARRYDMETEAQAAVDGECCCGFATRSAC